MQDYRNYEGYQKLNEKQKKAFKAMAEGKNVFLTGVAGTGKSFVINAFNDWKRQDTTCNVCVVAPTGLAAYLVNGVTLHSQFELGGVLPPRLAYDKYFNKLKAYKAKVLKNMHILEIEEISMVRYDYFRRVMQILDAEEGTGHHIQRIISGDFGQLCPILTNINSKQVNSKYHSEYEVFSAYYPMVNTEAWAFLDKEHWSQFEIHELTEVVRQSDKDFVRALNLVRLGDARGLKFINENKARKPSEDAVVLCGTNKQVQFINNACLSQLEGRSAISKLKYRGETDASAVPADDILEVKVGAKVMSLINDSGEFKNRQFYNGSFGTVTGFTTDDNTGELDSVTVVFDDTKMVHTFTSYDWEINGYQVNPQGHFEKVLLGTVTGIPLRLRYAMTVHKAQGHTFESVAMLPNFWDYGQLYTALSRVKSIQGFYCKDTISPRLIKSSNLVKDFYENLHNHEEYKKVDLKEYYKDKAFDLSELKI